MRLIDADELIEAFSWSEVCRLSIKEIIKIIREAPTIEERTKGKWEYTRNGIIYCNQCSHYLGFKGNYCPNCGSYMRGEENDTM